MRLAFVSVAALLAVAASPTHADEALDAALKRFDTLEGQRDEMRAKGMPVILRRVPPQYPRALAARKTTGCVIVLLTVTEDGLADNFQILNSDPPGAFDRAVLDALVLWQFEPRAVPFQGVQSFSFGFTPELGSHVVPGKRAPKDCAIPEVSTTTGASTDGLSVVERVAPYFPPEAVRAGVEGCATVTFDVRPDGLADNYEFSGSSPKGTFEKSVIWAMNQWRFAGATTTSRGAAVFEFNMRTKRDATKPEGCVLPSGFERAFNKAGTT